MLKLYNSLGRKIENFKPIHPLQVGMYTCGPTVYSFAHIGNFRTYTSADILLRVLKYNGYDVTYVINLTDVGHLTGDNLGDADLGEDRMEKAAQKEGKTAWEVAQFYGDVFIEDFHKLNLQDPLTFAKATDHIAEQIDLVKRLEEAGYTYEITDGIYFDTSLFPKYGELSNLDEIKAGARVEINPEKRNQRDFALWKFSPPESTGIKRQMEWKSPWGKGFPGWHIECSAMSMKYLGETFDIHTGGMDLRETHHPNEIAQAEAATGKKFVNYWVHGAFILVNGEKMSKSKNNLYTIYDLEKEGYDPLSLRYLYLQTHYRQEMNFTFASLDAATNALKKLRQDVAEMGEPEGAVKEYEERFFEAINDDLNMPKALAVMWELVKADEPASAKANSILKMDEVLGLNLQEETARIRNEEGIVPAEIKQLLEEREELRSKKQFTDADRMRIKIEKLGYIIEDNQKGTRIRKR